MFFLFKQKVHYGSSGCDKSEGMAVYGINVAEKNNHGGGKEIGGCSVYKITG